MKGDGRLESGGGLLMVVLLLSAICSTNKRILDEVALVPSKRLRNKISGCEFILGHQSHVLEREEFFLTERTSPRPRSHHPLDEANPEGSRPRNLFPIARRGEGEEGPVRSRRLCFGGW